MPHLKSSPRAVAWVATETAANAILLLLTMLLSARMVGASEFAVAALVVGTVQLLNLYVEGLFHDALIQNRAIDDSAFDKAFWTVLAISLVLLLSVSVAVLLVGPIYSRPAWLLLVATLSLPFSGALGVLNARLRRAFQHREVARASMAGRVVGATVGLTVAYLGLGAWGLVTQFTLGAIVNALFLYACSPWRPSPQVNLAGMMPLVRFALPYAFMHSLLAVRIQGFSILVAMLMGLAGAGFINVAFRLSTTPQMILSGALMSISFPVLARCQHDKVELRRSFEQVTRLVSGVTLPIFVGLALAAEDLVPLVLGAGWKAAIPMIQILSLGAAIWFTRLPGSFLLRALGNLQYSFYNAVLHLLLTLGGLLLFAPSDPRIAILLWVFPLIPTVAATPFVVLRVCGIPIWTQFRGAVAPAAATGLMAASVLALSGAVEFSHPLFALSCKALLGIAVFLMAVISLDGDLRRMLQRSTQSAL